MRFFLYYFQRKESKQLSCGLRTILLKNTREREGKKKEERGSLTDRMIAWKDAEKCRTKMRMDEEGK